MNKKAIAIFFTIVMCVILSVGLFQISRWVRLLSFKETQGVVKGENLKLAFLSPSGVGEYIPEIYYSFSVNGTAYQGNKFMVQYASSKYEANHGLKKWAQNILNKYNVGDKVAVYYNPSNPEECILSREFNWLLLLFFAFPVLFLFLFFKFAYPKIPEQIEVKGR